MISEIDVEAWWESLNKAQRLEILKSYIEVTNATPEITLPDYAAIITTKDVIIKPLSTGSIIIGHLNYELTFNEMMFKGVIPEPDNEIWSYILFGTTALCAGVIIGIVFE